MDIARAITLTSDKGTTPNEGETNMNKQHEIEMQLQKLHVDGFCEAARKFGFVIDPKTVGLELCADSEMLKQGKRALQTHREALSIGARLEWVA